MYFDVSDMCIIVDIHFYCKGLWKKNFDKFVLIQYCRNGNEELLWYRFFKYLRQEMFIDLGGCNNSVSLISTNTFHCLYLYENNKQKLTIKERNKQNLLSGYHF